MLLAESECTDSGLVGPVTLLGSMLSVMVISDCCGHLILLLVIEDIARRYCAEHMHDS